MNFTCLYEIYEFFTKFQGKKRSKKWEKSQNFDVKKYCTCYVLDTKYYSYIARVNITNNHHRNHFSHVTMFQDAEMTLYITYSGADNYSH